MNVTIAKYRKLIKRMTERMEEEVNLLRQMISELEDKQERARTGAMVERYQVRLEQLVCAKEDAEAFLEQLKGMV